MLWDHFPSCRQLCRPRQIVLSFLFAGVCTVLSLGINTGTPCCNHAFLAGWPIPFYGGDRAGAFAPHDQLFGYALLTTFTFWFLFLVGGQAALVAILPRFRRSISPHSPVASHPAENRRRRRRPRTLDAKPRQR